MPKLPWLLTFLLCLSTRIGFGAGGLLSGSELLKPFGIVILSVTWPEKKRVGTQFSKKKVGAPDRRRDLTLDEIKGKKEIVLFGDDGKTEPLAFSHVEPARVWFRRPRPSVKGERFAALGNEVTKHLRWVPSSGAQKTKAPDSLKFRDDYTNAKFDVSSIEGTPWKAFVGVWESPAKAARCPKPQKEGYARVGGVIDPAGVAQILWSQDFCDGHEVRKGGPVLKEFLGTLWVQVDSKSENWLFFGVANDAENLAAYPLIPTKGVDPTRAEMILNPGATRAVTDAFFEALRLGDLDTLYRLSHRPFETSWTYDSNDPKTWHQRGPYRRLKEQAELKSFLAQEQARLGSQLDFGQFINEPTGPETSDFLRKFITAFELDPEGTQLETFEFAYSPEIGNAFCGIFLVADPELGKVRGMYSVIQEYSGRCRPPTPKGKS